MSVEMAVAGFPAMDVAFFFEPKDVVDMDIKHHFGGGMYIKETHFKAGEWGKKHTHSFDHLSILVAGKVQLTIDNVSVEIEGPQILTVKADKVHQVLALTDATWYCCHATECTDPEKIDTELIARSHEQQD